MDQYPLLPFLVNKQCASDCLVLSAHNEEYSKILSSALDAYDKIHVIAYSLGVAIAHQRLEGETLFLEKKGVAIAVNGTLDPLSDSNGIAPEVFATMLANLSPSSVVDFTKKMCRKEYAFYEENFPKRSFESQKNELAYLYQNLQAVAEEDSFFDLAIIAKADMIIPAKVQNTYWRKTAKYKIAAPHFPFIQLKNVWNIIEIAQSYNARDVDAG